MTEKDKLMAIDRAFAKMSEEVSAAAAYFHFLSDDALHLPDQGDPVLGNGSIADSLKSLGPDQILTWEPQDGYSAALGDLGYTWGFYEIKDKFSDNIISRGKYLNIWRKENDGSWKVFVDIGNTSPFDSSGGE